MDCRFTAVIRLVEEDEVGCNWTDPKLKCSGTLVTGCKKEAGHIASKARELFNIK
jgi:hypothetical protein